MYATAASPISSLPTIREKANFAPVQTETRSGDARGILFCIICNKFSAARGQNETPPQLQLSKRRGFI